MTCHVQEGPKFDRKKLENHWSNVKTLVCVPLHTCMKFLCCRKASEHVSPTLHTKMADLPLSCFYLQQPPSLRTPLLINILLCSQTKTTRRRTYIRRYITDICTCRPIHHYDIFCPPERADKFIFLHRVHVLLTSLY